MKAEWGTNGDRGEGRRWDAVDTDGEGERGLLHFMFFFFIKLYFFSIKLYLCSLKCYLLRFLQSRRILCGVSRQAWRKAMTKERRRQRGMRGDK